MQLQSSYWKIEGVVDDERAWEAVEGLPGAVDVM
jgi:hypothetical protein